MQKDSLQNQKLLEIANRIKEMREISGFTEKEMAEKAGFANKYIRILK